MYERETLQRQVLNQSLALCLQLLNVYRGVRIHCTLKGAAEPSPSYFPSISPNPHLSLDNLPGFNLEKYILATMQSLFQLWAMKLRSHTGEVHSITELQSRAVFHPLSCLNWIELNL